MSNTKPKIAIHELDLVGGELLRYGDFFVCDQVFDYFPRYGDETEFLFSMSLEPFEGAKDVIVKMEKDYSHWYWYQRSHGVRNSFYSLFEAAITDLFESENDIEDRIEYKLYFKLDTAP